MTAGTPPPPQSRATHAVPTTTSASPDTTAAGPQPPPPRYTLVFAMGPPHAQPAPAAAMATPPPSRSAAHALHALVRRQFPHLPTSSAPVPGYAFLAAAGPAPSIATAAATAAHPPVLATVAFPVAADAMHHHHHHHHRHLFPTLPFAPPPGPPTLARVAPVPAPNSHGAAVDRGTPHAAAAAASGSRAGRGPGAPLAPSPALRAIHPHPSTPSGAGTDPPAPSLADLVRVESQLDLASTGCKGRAVTADMQDTFVRTLAAVHTIVKDKLYRARTPTMEQYFTQYHKISRAQVYRLLDCHAIMQDLRDFDRKPLKQRICRTLKKVTPAREPRRRLWQAVVDKWGHDPAAMANLTSADIVTTWTELVESDAALGAAASRDAASVDESDADGLDASDPAWAEGASPSVPPATPTPAPPPPVPLAMAAWSAAAAANAPWPDDAMWATVPHAVDPATHMVKTESAVPPGYPALIPPPLPPPPHMVADWWAARADHLAPGEFMPSRHRSPAPPALTPTPRASAAPAPTGAAADRGHPVVVFSVRASSAAPAPPATPTPARVDATRNTPDPSTTATTTAPAPAVPADLTSPLRPPSAAATPPPSTRGARGKARGKARGGTRGSTTKPRGGRGRGKNATAAAARDAVPVPPPKDEDEEEVASPAAKRRRRSRAEILLDEAAAAFAGLSSKTGSAARSRARRVPSAAAAAETSTTETGNVEKVKVKAEDGQEEGAHVKPERDNGPSAPSQFPTPIAAGPTPVPATTPAPIASSLPLPPPPPPAPAPNVVLQLSPALRPLPSAAATRPTLLEPTRVDDAWADFDADCLARLATSPVYASRRPIGHVRYRTGSAGGYQPGATGTGAFALPPASALGFMPPPAGPPPAVAMTASNSPWPSPRYRMPSFGLGLALPLPPPPPPPPPAVSAGRSRTASGFPTDLAAAAAADWPTRPGTPGGGNGAWVLASPRIDPARVGIQAPAAREEMQAWMDGGIAPYYLHAPMPAAGTVWSGHGVEGPWWMSEHEPGKGPAPAELAMEMDDGRSAPVDERRPFGAQ
ncbi:hypothetical protein GGF31_008146 [Allomyces arbusculus]|nr:hypothetical protein GGF31_008146 [Allomyces arbusculus]